MPDKPKYYFCNHASECSVCLSANKFVAAEFEALKKRESALYEALKELDSRLNFSQEVPEQGEVVNLSPRINRAFKMANAALNAGKE